MHLSKIWMYLFGSLLDLGVVEELHQYVQKYSKAIAVALFRIAE